MALITRVSRLFRADFHAVLDRIEEPDVLLKQAVREMQEDIDRDDQRLKFLDHEQGQSQKRLTELDQSLKQMEQELDVCFNANKEDIARVLVKRKLEAERLRNVLMQKSEVLENQLEELNNRLIENRSRLLAMQQKLELLSKKDALSQFDRCSSYSEFSVQDDDLEVAFLLEKQKRKPS
ncbi:PspA/IM30 family protein [Pseudomonadota bacterium]